MYKVVAFAACLTVVTARPQGDGPYAPVPKYAPAPPKYAPAPPKYAPAPYKEEKLVPLPFAYEYGVKDDYSGAAFTKSETQNGAGEVEGSYQVNLPDPYPDGDLPRRPQRRVRR